MGFREMAEAARPWLLGAMTSLFVARLLFPSESAAVQGDGLSVVMLWIMLGACWLLGRIAQREFRLRFGWIDAAVLALIAWHTIAAILAVWHGSPRPAINMLWQWIGFGMAFFLARQLIDTAAERRALVAVMIGLAVGLSGYGLYQRVYEMPADRAAYEADPDAALRAAGLWYPPDSPQRELFESRLEDNEPRATFALTNSLAGYLAPWLVMAVGVVFCGRWTDTSMCRWRFLMFAACIGLVGVCLVLTQSRTAMLATGAGLILVGTFCREGKRPLGWKLPLVAAAASLAVLAVAAAGGMLPAAWKSLGYRIEYWQSTMQMIGQRPLFGCGPGNFQQVYARYKLPQASEEVADPHNFIMEIWATAGTPAMLAMLAVLACFFWASRRRQDDDSTEDGGADASRFVLGGAAFGYLMGWPLGMISFGGPNTMALLLGFPLAVACVGFAHGWIGDGRLPRYLTAVGVAVLLINLLAAGGIGLPGVAGSLWLLLAIGMPVRPLRHLGWPLAALGVVAVFMLAAGCYFTAYGPVLRCRLQMQLARRQPLHMKEHLLTATEADPFEPRPWRDLTALALLRWSQTGDEADYRNFERCNAKTVELAANSPLAWRTAGGLYVEAFNESSRYDSIEKAVKALGRAVELYPNSAQYRADLALAMLRAGDGPGFEQQREVALRLDRLTPHCDKKIHEETRKELIVAPRRK